jgi:peptidoglycan hydrolase-like amidase
VGAEKPVAASGTAQHPARLAARRPLHRRHFDITSTTAVQTYNGTLSLTVNFN